jgi:hypothetical protein
MSYLLPNTITIKNPNFSVKVNEEIESLFPNIKEKPLTRFKAEVEIVTAFNKNSIKEIFIDSSRNLQKTIIDCATFAADFWIEDDLVEDDDLSLIDLKYAIVKFEIPNVSISEFIVQLEYCTKVTEIN